MCCLLFAYVWSTPCLHFLSHHFLEQPLHFYCPKFLSLPEHRLSFLVLDVGSSCSHWLDGCSFIRTSHPFIYLPSRPHSGLSSTSSLSNHVLVSWFMWVSTELSQHLMPTSKHLSWHGYLFLGCLPPATHQDTPRVVSTVAASSHHCVCWAKQTGSHVMLWAYLVDAFLPILCVCVNKRLWVLHSWKLPTNHTWYVLPI